MISPMVSATRCTDCTMPSMAVPASPTRRAPSSTRSTEAPMSWRISLAAAALRCASVRTSLATTAKPRPCSPARAASTAAFSARMLVWKAMESMTPTMSAICLLLSLMPFMVSTTRATTSPPRWATCDAPAARLLACWALLALCCSVLVNCSMAAAVSCRLLEVCSVRTDRSWLPVAISALAMAMLSVLWRTCCTMPDSDSLMACSERSRSPNSSARCACPCTPALRSPAAMRSASSLASARGRRMLAIRKWAPMTMPSSSTPTAAAAKPTVSLREAAISCWLVRATCSCICTKSRSDCR